MKLQTAGDLMSADPNLTLVVYGPTGSGKTTWAARAPTPLFILADHHGAQSVARANPHALVLWVQTWADLVQVGKALTLGGPCQLDDQPAFGFTLDGTDLVVQTVVVDTLDDVQEMAIAHIEQGGGSSKDLRDDSDDLSQQGWGRLFKLMRALVKGLRALPVNVVLLSSAQEREQEGSKRVRVLPAVDGKLRSKLGGWCHAMGYARVRVRDSEPMWEVCWRLGEMFDTKPGPGFPAVMENTAKPGQTTLGSLLLAQAERCWPDASVVPPHCEGDSSEWVGPEVAPVESNATKSKPRVATVTRASV